MFNSSINDPESIQDKVVMQPKSELKHTIGDYSSQIIGIDGG